MLDVNVIKMPSTPPTTTDSNLVGKKAKSKNSGNTSEDIATWVNSAGKLRDSNAGKEKMSKQPQVKILQKSTDSKQYMTSQTTSSAMFPIQSVPGIV